MDVTSTLPIAIRQVGRAARFVFLATLINGALLSMACAAQKTFTCTPVDVAVFVKQRVHVRCGPGDGAIQWFALGVSDQNEANRVLSLVSTAFATQKRLTVWYDPADLSGAAIGCANNDCRMIQGLAMF